MVTSRYYRPPPPLPDPATLPYPGNVIRLCRACDLRSGCTAPVPGVGPTPARVLFAGQNPGKNEDAYGLPFIGQAGQQLDSLLFRCSLSRDSVYITNLCRCLTFNNQEPKPHQVTACSPWLDIEIELVQPEIIVAMGAPAIRHFLGRDAGTVEHLHGKPVEVKVGSRVRIVIPSYHPAAALHDTSKLRHLNEDFEVLRGVLAGHDLSRYVVQDDYPDPVYRVADTPALVREMLDEIRAVGECAVDVETVDHGARIWSYQVSAVPGTAWFVPVSPDFQGRINTRDWGARIIVHHYLNDIQYLDIEDGNYTDSMVQAYLVGQAQGLKELASRLCGIKMQTYSEVVRPAQRGLSTKYLEQAASREWGPPPEIYATNWDNKAGRVVTKLKKPWHISRKIKDALKKVAANPDYDPIDKWNKIPDAERAEVESALGRMPEASLADIDFQQAVDYSSRDAMSTFRSKLKLDTLIDNLGLQRVLQLDLDILPMVAEMMRNGMATNVPYYRELSADYAVRMAAKAEELATLVGHPFNPNSSDQVAAVIYGELGFKPTKYTDSGEISTDDAELKKTGHPVAKGVIFYRQLSKLKGTYADNMIRSSHPDEHGVTRIHTVLTTTRVETGRLSSKKDDDGEGANLQNIPTRNEEAKKIKRGFVAPEGKVLLEGDLAQVEMRTQAHLADCKGLKELFLRGVDVHTTTASRLFGVSYEQAGQSKYRYPCKRAGFGIIYLIGAKGLSTQINEYIADLEMAGEPVDVEPWDEVQCQKFIDDYYKLYPEIRNYQLERVAEARRKGYVTDIIGRIRYIPEVTSPIKAVAEAGGRQAANFPVTASAQEIIKGAMVAIWREGPKTEWAGKYLSLMQIHDSLLFQVDDRKEVYEPFARWVRQVMCNVIKLSIPVDADFKVGVNWADMKKVKL